MKHKLTHKKETKDFYLVVMMLVKPKRVCTYKF